MSYTSPGRQSKYKSTRNISNLTSNLKLKLTQYDKHSTSPEIIKNYFKDTQEKLQPEEYMLRCITDITDN